MTHVPDIDGWYWYRQVYINKVTGVLTKDPWEIVQVGTFTIRNKPVRQIIGRHWRERVDRMIALDSKFIFGPKIEPPPEDEPCPSPAS